MSKRAETLTTKQRALLMASDGEWRTVDELVERADEQRGAGSRKAERVRRPWAYETLLEFNGVLWDYGRPRLTPQDRMRHGIEDGTFRLNRAGRILQAELLRLKA
jgi:hypothetical protein